MKTISKVFAAVVGAAFIQPIVMQPVQAQSLSQRIASAPDGRVQFNFPSRESACGDGRTFMRVSYGTSSNDMYGSWSNGVTNQPCERGPVRVVLEQAARAVVGIKVNVVRFHRQMAQRISAR